MNDERFWFWINERERIRKKKLAGDPPPWTEDPVMREWRFTNVRREDDAVTLCIAPYRVAFSTRPAIRFLPARIMALRFFNRIDVIEHIVSSTPSIWSDRNGGIKTKQLEKTLRSWRPNGPWTTGSFIINSPNGMDKLRGVCWMIEQSKPICLKLAAALLNDEDGSVGTMENVTQRLKAVPHVADFMAYEVACDLRFTQLMPHPPDVRLWANPGPGAKRGLARIHGRRIHGSGVYKRQLIQEMVERLERAPNFVEHEELANSMELREIEHSLCEYDKWERVHNGQGTPRQRYKYGTD